MKPSQSFPLAFLGLLLGLAACQSGAPAPAADEEVLIELRLVEDVPSDASLEAELNGERLSLNAAPVLSDADIQTIDPVIESGRLLLSIELTEEGREKLRRATAEHIGERMAFILDGQVRSAPVIRDSISGGVAQVPVDVSGPEADSLMAKIRARW